MNVLVDTTVWSLAFRRTSPLPARETWLRDELGLLIVERRARLIGLIRQELLSGIREASQYVQLRDQMGTFADEPLHREDFERAALMSNRCRRAGFAGSTVDFLICAVAAGRRWPIFTTDEDFERYRNVLPIRLYEPTR